MGDPTVASEYTVIGYLKGEPDVLVFDNFGEVPTKLCQLTDQQVPERAKLYRRRYLQHFPGKLGAVGARKTLRSETFSV